MFFKKMSLQCCLIFFSFCAVAKNDADPWEDYNRAIFEFNNVVDEILLEPLAEGYEALLPPFARDRIHAFLSNLSTPLSFVNSTLQIQPEKAGNVLVRFLVNTTFGVFGLFDVATQAGFPEIPADFDQTLQEGGAPMGPYLMLPILGPSSARGMVGLIGDTFLDPFNIWARRSDHMGLAYVRAGADLLDYRSRHLEDLRELKKDSLDLYATWRSLYFQRHGDKLFEQKPHPTTEGPRPFKKDKN